MEVKVIHSEAQYNKALDRAFELLQQDLIKGSKEYNELELLSLVLENYEDRVHTVPPPNPIEAIRFRMEQMGVSESELNKILGGRQRKHEILTGKRKLSLNHIRKISRALDIDPGVLIQEY